MTKRHVKHPDAPKIAGATLTPGAAWPAEKEEVTAKVVMVPLLGRCRRHAPTMAGYPVVTPTDWCGDHKLIDGRALTASMAGDPWANRAASMRCASCLHYVPKRD